MTAIIFSLPLVLVIFHCPCLKLSNDLIHLCLVTYKCVGELGHRGACPLLVSCSLSTGPFSAKLCVKYDGNANDINDNNTNDSRNETKNCTLLPIEGISCSVFWLQLVEVNDLVSNGRKDITWYRWHLNKDTKSIIQEMALEEVVCNLLPFAHAKSVKKKSFLLVCWTKCHKYSKATH